MLFDWVRSGATGKCLAFGRFVFLAALGPCVQTSIKLSISAYYFMGVRGYGILARVVLIGVPEIKRVYASDEDREVHTIPESVPIPPNIFSVELDHLFHKKFFHCNSWEGLNTKSTFLSNAVGVTCLRSLMGQNRIASLSSIECS